MSAQTDKEKSFRTIPVIASFSAEGKMVPIVLGLRLEDGSFARIHVDKVMKTERKCGNFLVYDCLITVLENAKTVIQVGYDEERNQWRILGKR
ncbi:MAG: hypothetical protein ACOX8H_12855 [Ruminococcus sp.]